MRVAIDVHERVLRPVRRRQARQRVAICLALEEPIEPFDDFVAPIGVRHRVDQHDQVLAHALDHRLLRDGQPVGQLQHGFRGAGFVRMQGGVEIVDRPCARDDLLGCCGIRLARIGQRGSVFLQLIERLDALLVRNRQQHDVAPFLRAADREDLDARRSRGEGARVAVRRRGIDQLARRAGNPFEERARRRHRGGGGERRDPGRQELRRGRGLCDLLGRARLGAVLCAGVAHAEREGEKREPTDAAH